MTSPGGRRTITRVCTRKVELPTHGFMQWPPALTHGHHTVSLRDGACRFQVLSPRSAALAKRWAKVAPPPMTSPIRFTPRHSTRLAHLLQPYLRLPLLPPVAEAATVGWVEPCCEP